MTMLFCILALVSEAMRRAADGLDNARIYGMKEINVHAVQQLESRFGYVTAWCAASAALWPMADAWHEWGLALVTAALMAYGAAMFGNYYFQARINAVYGHPPVWPGEPSHWETRTGKMRRKFWYGSRRKYQRMVAVAVVIISFVVYLLCVNTSS